jgi:thiol-disulfide isomerase/thioredoxin
MKYITVLFAAYLIIACNEPKTNIEKGTAIISGQIIKPIDSMVNILDDYGKSLIMGKLDSSGLFNIGIDLDEPASFYFEHGDEWEKIYLEPGMELIISLNTESFDETLKFEGKGAVYNNYLREKFLLVEKIESSGGVFSMNDLEKIKTYYINKEDSMLSLLESSNFNSRSKFYINEKNDIQFENYTYQIRRYNNLKSQNVDTFKGLFIKDDSIRITYERIRPDSLIIPDNFFDFMSEIDLESDDVLKHEDFLLKLCEFDFWSKNSIPDSVGYKERTLIEVKKMLEIINTRFNNNKAKSIVIEQKLKRYISRRLGIEVLEPYFKHYLVIETDSQKLAEYKEIYANLNALSTGNQAPEFSATDMSGKKVSLSDFIGKFVYIDIWSTWCSPCRKEIPFLADLEHELKDENIVFVSVSLDKDSTAWANMLIDKNMKGIQLLAENAFKSDIAKSYIVKNIPRFLLIDPEGKIVNHNAARPSRGAKEEIQKALVAI